MSIVSDNTKSLRVDLQPSIYSAIILFSQHLLAIIILFLCPLPWLVLFIVAVICGMSLSHCLGHYAWLTNSNAVRSIISINNQWLLLTNDEQAIQTQLLGSSFKGANIILLNFKSVIRRKKISVIIMKDSLDATSWRKLRAHLVFVKIDKE